MAKDSINIKKSHKGRLHQALHIPYGENITDAELEKALKSKDPAERLMARFAKNARKFKHGGTK